MSENDLIRRMDAIQSCQVGPSDEWSKSTKDGYSQAATDCSMNILRIAPAVLAELPEVRALVAAALQRAAYRVDFGWGHNAGNVVRALIPRDHAAALEAVKAQAREEAVDIAKLERIANELSCIDAQCRAFADRIMSAIRAGKVQP